MRHRTWAVFATAVWLGAVSGAAARADSIVNGSFESGPAVGVSGSVVLNPGSVVIPGWTTTRGRITYLNEVYWVANTGTRSVSLHDGQPGGISQTFPTQSGAVYRLSFVMSGEPFVTPFVRHLRATTGSATQDFNTDISPAWHWDMGWAERSWEFSASGPSTTLELYSLETGAFGPAIDDVAVNFVSASVPGSPSALAFAPLSPSPARTQTRLSFTLPRAQRLRISAHDVSGREVALLVDDVLAPGTHDRAWDVSRLPVGVYLVRLAAGAELLTRRIAVVH